LSNLQSDADAHPDMYYVRRGLKRRRSASIIIRDDKVLAEHMTHLQEVISSVVDEHPKLFKDEK
jgi:hypothetical protein